MDFNNNIAEADIKIREILRQLFLSMNGVTSEKMEEMGLVYKKNLGVPLTRIKEIAARYQPSHLLAQKLWHGKYRETKIMAFMLEQPDVISPEMAMKLADEIDNTELAETGAMFLFSKTAFAADFCLNCIKSSTLTTKITGYYTAARITEKLNENEKNEILSVTINNLNSDNYHLGKSISVFLSRMCRRSKETAYLILNQVKSDKTPASVIKPLIIDAVEQEIKFFVHD